MVHVGTEFRDNPNLWRSKHTLAARIFVGFKVGNRTKWKMDDVVDIVRKVRTKQSGDPSSTFIAQRGIYKHSDGSGVVDEAGAQVILIDSHGTKMNKWREDVLKLAEIIAKKLQQESVVVEIQKNGLSVDTFGVGP